MMAYRGGAMAVLRAPTSFAARTAAERKVPSSWMRVARLQQQHGQLQPIAVPAQAGLSVASINSQWWQQQRSSAAPWLAAGAGLAGMAAVALTLTDDARASTSCEAPGDDPGQKTHIYTRAEVAMHGTLEKRIWVTYEEGVYDITDFIVSHPGGVGKIMLAAGKAIDPFWRIYQQHTNSKLPKQLLSEMRIGTLDPNEPAVEVDENDPYANEPDRHPALTYHNRTPANAELPPTLIMDKWITPSELFFIRHHHPVPTIKVAEFNLDVRGFGIKPILLSLEDLRFRFPKTEVTATLQCGGNRRSGFNEGGRKTSGIAWGFGAMSNAKWGGVLLRDVLMYSGLLTPQSAKNFGVHHVCFKAVDGVQASIPIEKALSPYGDVLLAYEMNDKPLPPEHGGPLRIIVPGHVGIRNIKWVQEIQTSPDEAEGYWQRGAAYKGFAPGVTSFADVDIEKLQSVQEQPVTSAIVEPQELDEVEPNQPVTLKGLAWSGGGRGIVRVDVSADGGATWHTAELKSGSEQHKNQAWAWTFWEIEVPYPEGGVIKTKVGEDQLELMCKATDISYNSQPESPEPIWNIRGLNNNSWHRVRVNVATDDEEDD